MKKSLLILTLLTLCTKISYCQIDAVVDTTAIGLGATSTNPAYKFTYQSHSIAHFGLGWYDDTDLPGAPMAYLGGYGGIKFFTNGTPRFTITNNGNVGIGTTSPGAKLDVSGNANFGTATGGYTLSVGGSGNDYGSVGYNQQYGSITGAYTYKVSDYASFVKFDAGGFKFMTAPTGTAGTAISPSTVMTVLNNGNVGIGTTTPGALLDINGAVSTGSMATTTNAFQEVVSNSYYGISGTSYPGQFRWYTSPNNSLHKDLALYQLRAWDTGSLTENTILNIQGDGAVLIGAAAIPAGYKLAVAGNAIAESMTVKLQANWPDVVFKKDYALMPLSDVKTYIDKNQHLPEIPAAAEVEKDGVNLGEMNRLLVKKVEELTLYLIELNKTVKEQQTEIDQLKKQNAKE